MAKRKICVVTGTRAEYGLLRWVIDGIAKSPVLELQLIATGMHLSPEFGLTVQEMEADGHRIDRKVEMLLSSDTPVGITKSMGLGMIGFADALSELQPDLLLLLGDRFEIFAAASAALIARIPIAHIHGGELTEGAFDDALRHSITKMSQLHFVVEKEYQKRVLQLGEDPSRVFLIPTMAFESIKRLKLLCKEKLEKELNFEFGSKSLLITYHPVTLENNTSYFQMKELLASLSKLKDTHIIFTCPNADSDSRAIINLVRDFCSNHPFAKFFTSLGQLIYYSCLMQVDGVIGNSSSGIIEAPLLGLGTVNIGDRQKGRVMKPSIINSTPDAASISLSIELLYAQRLSFEDRRRALQKATSVESPADLILKYITKSIDSGFIIKKRFFDMPINVASQNYLQN